jgi:hypothetical protein
MRSGAVALALAVALAACGSDVPVAPEPTGVGPAPLRALDNVELLNTLRDLFPDVKAELPPLPDDVPVAGFENAVEGQRASDVRVARIEAIAHVVADHATRDPSQVRALTGCDAVADAALAQRCAAALFDGVGRRIFRRPLADEERARLSGKLEEWRRAIDFAAAVRLTLAAMLQSPRFTHRVELAGPGAAPGALVALDGFAIASRLSFLLWESGPDDALLDAAARGELDGPDGVRAAAERMLADPRARRSLYGFHRQWLGLDRILLEEHAARAPEVDAEWSRATRDSAAAEIRLFVEETLAGGGTLRDLLTSDAAWVDGEMARVYGLPPPPQPGVFTKVTLPRGERAGLLTRASFLASFSHRGGTSPPVRGNGVQLRLLCQLPISPPPGADLSQPKPAPGEGPRTTRSLFEERTRPASCQGCHAGLNGFGFAFERYDASGRFRTQEAGLPIDPRGAIVGTDVDGPVDDALALSERLARSRAVQRCAARQWFRYAFARAPVDVEASLLDSLTERFAASGGDPRRLLLALVTAPTFRYTRAEAPP